MIPADGSTPAPLRIFVVEDHADTARAVAIYLRGSGYEVHVANDAKTARELASRTEFDILLSDLRLPDGNGWDLLRELRGDRSFIAIAMSGHHTDADRERSRKAGFVEHLAKPLTPEELDAAFARATRDGK